MTLSLTLSLFDSVQYEPFLLMNESTLMSQNTPQLQRFILNLSIESLNPPDCLLS